MDDEGARLALARDCLNRGDVEQAAALLDRWDGIRVDLSEFGALAKAVTARGLTALYEDGVAFLYAPADADRVLAEMITNPSARPTRKPPLRALREETPAAKRKSA